MIAIVVLTYDLLERCVDDLLLRTSLRTNPKMGYLVADLKEDPNDSAYCYLQYAKEQRNVFTRKKSPASRSSRVRRAAVAR